MKTKIIIISLSAVALMSLGAVRAIKSNPKSQAQSTNTNNTYSPIGGLETDDK